MPVLWRVTKLSRNAAPKNTPKTKLTRSAKNVVQRRRLNSLSEMKKQERPLSPYPIQPNKTDLYEFVTDSSVVYEIEFKATPYLFDEESPFSTYIENMYYFRR